MVQKETSGMKWVNQYRFLLFGISDIDKVKFTVKVYCKNLRGLFMHSMKHIRYVLNYCTSFFFCNTWESMIPLVRKYTFQTQWNFQHNRGITSLQASKTEIWKFFEIVSFNRIHVNWTLTSELCRWIQGKNLSKCGIVQSF